MSKLIEILVEKKTSIKQGKTNVNLQILRGGYCQERFLNPAVKYKLNFQYYFYFHG